MPKRKRFLRIVAIISAGILLFILFICYIFILNKNVYSKDEISVLENKLLYGTFDIEEARREVNFSHWRETQIYNYGIIMENTGDKCFVFSTKEGMVTQIVYFSELKTMQQFLEYMQEGITKRTDMNSFDTSFQVRWGDVSKTAHILRDGILLVHFEFDNGEYVYSKMDFLSSIECENLSLEEAENSMAVAVPYILPEDLE